MKWRLIDRIERFEPWHAIVARKTVSFEEYSLLKPFGRKGSFPQTLVLEAGVESVRWLVAASSQFTQTCALADVDRFAFRAEAGCGDVLALQATVLDHDEKVMRCEISIRSRDREVASGRLTLGLLPLRESFDAEWVTGLWRELYAQAR